MDLVLDNQSGSAAATILAKSRGSSVGSATTVQDDDTIGTLQFSGADGTNDIAGAFIRAQVDGTLERMIFLVFDISDNSPRSIITNRKNAYHLRWWYPLQ